MPIGIAAGLMDGDLPTALARGRGTSAGPVTGGYLSFGLSNYSTAVADLTDLIVYAIEMPCDFRVEAISWALRNMDVSASFQVATNATLLWDSSETDLLSANVTLTDATGEVLVAAGSSQTLVDAARDIDKGEFLMIAVTDGSAAAIDDLTVEIIGFPLAHINTDPADD